MITFATLDLIVSRKPFNGDRSMPDFEKQFEAFNLSKEKSEEFKKLASKPFAFSKPVNAFVIETVLIENGKRVLKKTEIKNAELV